MACVWALTAALRAMRGQPDRLDDAVGELRCRRRPASEHLTGRVLGVDRVALAVEASLAGTRRTGHLDDLHGVAAQEPGEADPVAAGALDPERVDTAERAGPLEQLGVACVVGGDVELPERPPSPSMMTATCSCLWVSTPTMTWERSSAMLDMMVGLLDRSTVTLDGRVGGQDRDGTCCDQAPMRSLSARPASNLIGVQLRPTDTSTQGHHGRS